MTRTDSAPEPTAMLPDLQLAWPDGRPIRLSDYRQDRNLVAVFSGGAECAQCRHVMMSDLCSRPEEYAQAGAMALLVLQCSPLEAELVRRSNGLTLPVVLDPTGQACRLLGALSPDGKPATAVVVTDCAGRIYLANRPDQSGLPPTREEILSCLRRIPDVQCADRKT